jgi:hypothetical protein
MPLDMQRRFSIYMTINMTDLSQTDYRLVYALVTPQTSTEVFKALGLSYPYGIKRLGALKRQGLVEVYKHKGKDYYRTCRTPQTLDMFGTSVGSSTEYQFHLGTEKVWSFPTILSKLKERKTKEQRLDLIEHMMMIIGHLRARSYRTEMGQPNQLPDELTLKRDFERRILQEELNIKIAREMLRAPIWSGKSEVYKQIAAGEITENQLKASDATHRRFNEGLMDIQYGDDIK